ncbi:hypothetical protein ELE36_01280 [Pseudolysobacter antarcticus]|uniref:Uncharacterized protein n=1 Tax=Pseudolysobacter antarcticus TaxID=2511995 RepID=A0A411HF72_9GAMM|nr:hypothetical protein [Pseudolysobacter antarcticus]QBB69121.1 hypothetical protein ELE36_01280 [Pseudolysobacter antarcticus]
MPDPQSHSLCPALLALELDAGSASAQLVLDRDAAADLASLVAADLARLVPGADALGLALLGAVYDQAQILRPGWPIYAELAEHYTRAIRIHGAEVPVFALGAHDDQMPSPLLQPERELLGGTMLLIPWILIGDATRVGAVGELMERDFVAKGEASAATADWLMRRFGLRLQHARYLTRNDLCALASVQLEHAGFGPLWQLLEGALLTPAQNEEAISASGQTFFYDDGRITTAPRGYHAWAASEAAAYYNEPHEFVRGFAAYLFELRQYAALLKAHELPLHLLHTSDTAHAEDGGYWIETLAHANTPGARHVFAHELRGLGVIVLTVAAVADGNAHPIAHAYPIQPNAFAAALDELHRRFGSSGAPIRLGELAINHAEKTLIVPPQALANLPRTH